MGHKMVANPAENNFDWAAIRQRMEAIKSELSDENEPPLEALQSVWAEHARQLAKKIEIEQFGRYVNLVFINLGEEEYALEADYVFDIRPAEKITPVPHVPDWVCGVYNLRGHILSVIKLSHFLDLPQQRSQDKVQTQPYLVVTQTPDMECAFMVDQVLAVQAIPLTKIQSSTENVRSLQPKYVDGVVNFKGEEFDVIATLLNIQAILGDKRLVVNQDSG